MSEIHLVQTRYQGSTVGMKDSISNSDQDILELAKTTNPPQLSARSLGRHQLDQSGTSKVAMSTTKHSIPEKLSKIAPGSARTPNRNPPEDFSKITRSLRLHQITLVQLIRLQRAHQNVSNKRKFPRQKVKEFNCEVSDL